LRALEDRYKRFQIPIDGRPTLSDELLVHLGLSPSESNFIYVWRVQETLEFNSVSFRNKDHDQDWEALADLPP
jgi:hypothetical protein